MNWSSLILSVESNRHLFFDCAWTTKVWEWLPNGSRIKRKLCNSLMDFLHEQMLSLSHREFALLGTALWIIWRTRNKAMFEGAAIHISRVISDIHSTCAEVWQSTSSPEYASCAVVDTSAKPLLRPSSEMNVWYAFVNASLIGSHSAAGALLIGSSCNILHAAVKPTGHASSYELAELDTICFGLQ